MMFLLNKPRGLKTKKGFTLVELIVVIAIIGVLAAILVPVMMGHVTKASVTSADKAASSIGSTVSRWVMDLVCEGGAIPSESTVTIEVVSGNISVTADNTFLRANGDDAGGLLEEILGNDYSFGGKNASAVIYIDNNKVVGTVYYEGSTPAEIPGLNDFRSGSFAWHGSLDGVASGGDIVGTSPKLWKP